MKHGERNSSIEAVKVVAIIMIVISHSVPRSDAEFGDVFSIACATRDVNVFVALLFKNLGQVGNYIFATASAWFLMDCSEVKSRKILCMIADCFMISVAWLGILTVFGYHFPAIEMLKQIFPVSFGNNWFITCYLLLYLVHPLLNIIVERCGKRQLLMIVCMVIIMYFGLALLYKELLYYNNFLGFIGVYFVVAYMKKYLNRIMNLKKTQIVLLMIGIGGWLLVQFITNWLGLHIAALESHMLHWNQFNNPFFMCIGVSLFYMAKRQTWKNRAINYLSSLSLLIYIMTENYLFRNYVSYNCFGHVMDFFGTGSSLVGSILIFALILLLGGAFASILYRCTIQKAMLVLCGWLDEIGHKMANRVLTALMRVE